MSRTDRRTHRSSLDPEKPASNQGIGELSGDDTYPSPTALVHVRRRVSAAELSRLSTRLSERDHAVLASLSTLKLATVVHLQTLHFHGHASDLTARRLTRRTLARLHELHLVHQLKRRVGGIRAGSAGHVYTLTPVGHRLLGQNYRRRSSEPSLHHGEHTLAITGTIAGLHDASRQQDFDLETIQAEPTCWRSDPNGLHSTLKPDLYVELAQGEIELRWFLEIDCATESSRVLGRKLAAYTSYWQSRNEQTKHGVFPKVLWIAPDEARATFIQRTIDASADAEPKLFAVTTAEQAVATITDFS